MLVHKITYDSHFIFKKNANSTDRDDVSRRNVQGRWANKSNFRPAYDAFYVNFILNENK